MDALIERAAQRLLQGGLVAFPTETVYGLGADAENTDAIACIYAAKGRPSNHPVIVHLAPGARIDYWASHVPPQAHALIDAFWPGPLTLILPRADHIPAAVAGGQGSIGLRCPSHDIAQALLQRFAELKGGQGGVAAPSANKFGQVSPTHADHVRSEFAGLSEQELLILEGGAAQVGIESTILDLSRLQQGVGPVILRPGHITAAEIGEVLGVPPTDFASAGGQAHANANASGASSSPLKAPSASSPDAATPRVSGSLKAHYAPRTPLQVLAPRELIECLQSPPPGRTAAVVFESTRPGLPAVDGVEWVVVEAEASSYARNLYALMRKLDQGGYERLIFEQPPQTGAWQAVNDRLGRAAAAWKP